MGYAIKQIEPVKRDIKPAMPFADCLPGNGFVVPLSDHSMPSVRARAIQAARSLGRVFKLECGGEATTVICVGYCDPRPRQRRKLADKPQEPVAPASPALAAPVPIPVLPVLPDGATGWGDAPKAEPEAIEPARVEPGACPKCGSFHGTGWPCLFE